MCIIIYTYTCDWLRGVYCIPPHWSGCWTQLQMKTRLSLHVSVYHQGTSYTCSCLLYLCLNPRLWNLVPPKKWPCIVHSHLASWNCKLSLSTYHLFSNQTSISLTSKCGVSIAMDARHSFHVLNVQLLGLAFSTAPLQTKAWLYHCRVLLWIPYVPMQLPVGMLLVAGIISFIANVTITTESDQ